MTQGHIASYRTKTNEIRVKQDTRRVDGLGGEVWPGAHVLCAHLEANQLELRLQEAKILELGAGCGLCGLVASALGARHVVLTDEYPDLLQINIDLNKDWTEGRLIDVKELEWGEMNQVDGQYDIILGSEITQVGRDAHEPLLKTISWAFHTKSVALLSMDACDVNCKGDCDPSHCIASHFCKVARNLGFLVHKHPSIQLTSMEAVTSCVGALGRPWPLNGTELCTVFELRR